MVIHSQGVCCGASSFALISQTLYCIHHGLLMLEMGCSALAPMGCEFVSQWWGLRPTDKSTCSISETR